ncbi:hypothetical protein CAEBREN_06185 [Caenorhabditis brenneri]|uniref:C2H2-type domain-containing protein n=1 Tax=Caenorhabditis brenneri TaxID=135651 RepID=G0MR44_CAEBE|nr:hypothetical protein CAEBREN_06185 [Caenorhabditis brenneri]
MYSNPQQSEDMYPLNHGPIMSDEEIDIMNSGDEEDEMMREQGGPYRHPAEVYMVNDDDGMYDDDQLQYGYVDDEGYGGAQGLDADGYIDAHYINTDDGYMGGKDDDIYQITQSPQNVVHCTSEDRLAKYPEMRNLPPLRRMRKPLAARECPVDYVQKVNRVLNPKASAVNALWVANKVYPGSDGELPRKQVPGPMIPAEIYIKQTRLTTGKPVICEPSGLYRVHRSKPSVFPDQRITSDVPHHMMTPLPDRFFQKRCTITAEAAGFTSECIPCKHCNCLFRMRSQLDTHEKKHADKTQTVVEAFRLICPAQNCNIRGDTIATIIQHLKVAHGKNDILFETVSFRDMTEFKLWRSELERLTMSRFSRTSGKQNISSKSTYYQCHHSGNIPTSRDGPDERQRKRHTKKLGRTCTAFFQLKENDDGTVILRGCTKHTGHGKDIRSLPVTDDIKMEIAQYLIQGLDENEIVAKMQQTSDENDRRFYLQNYEVRNVYTKIERYKEDYKRRMLTGDVLPDLAEVVTSKADRPLFPSVAARAKLACSRFPVPAEHYRVEYEYSGDEPASYEEVVEEDGLFHVPKGVEEYVDRTNMEIKEETIEVEEEMAVNPRKRSAIDKSRNFDDDDDYIPEEEVSAGEDSITPTRISARLGMKKAKH